MLDLQERAIATSSDREAWLRGRRGGVTATEISKLEAGGAAFGRILDEKRSGVQSFQGNKYTEYGKAREEFIAAWVQERFDISPNQTLFRSVDDEQHLATPDGVGVDFEGDLVLAEIKTSKYNLAVVPRDYFVQMQWQMHVMGASRVLFAWEQHDDAWPDPEPIDDEPRFQWIDRDQAEIDRLVEIADRFLEALNAEPEATEYDFEMDELAQLVLVHREEESVAKSAKEDAWKSLQARLALKSDYSQRSGVAQITRSITNKTVDEPDEDAARAADPELAARYDAAVAEFADLLSKHKKKVLKSSVSLTVTAVKKEVSNG